MKITTLDCLLTRGEGLKMVITDKWIEENKGLIWKVVNTFKMHDEDLFQIAVLGAIESAPRYNEESGVIFSTFIYECMRNKLMMYTRRMITIKRGGQSTTTSLDDFESADVMNYRRQSTTYNMEDSIYIESILTDSRLTDKQAEIIKLHIVDNLSFSDIARLKNQSRQSIHSLFKNGVLKIKDKIVVA